MCNSCGPTVYITSRAAKAAAEARANALAYRDGARCNYMIKPIQSIEADRSASLGYRVLFWINDRYVGHL